MQEAKDCHTHNHIWARSAILITYPPPCPFFSHQFIQKPTIDPPPRSAKHTRKCNNPVRLRRECVKRWPFVSDT